jgi:hypothetical protein
MGPPCAPGPLGVRAVSCVPVTEVVADFPRRLGGAAMLLDS